MIDDIREYFRLLRFHKDFHLGLGDIRLTIAMQEEVIKIVEEISKCSHKDQKNSPKSMAHASSPEDIN